ncbi:primosomal protein [Gordonia sp. (in: high G+C Gram-positive bacteria)]|uniref:primosomal protein n=1 Tax=unclassified Gordonia (in: high G+C Gram-positive bacteria) TaxID=2657482 RepID=UPI002610F5AD|nr:primosomal protein [Gordonia sp. (in: high G+C Gram-positive bacteria)]
MAGDIVPIELGLTDGNLFTLWAPRWREGDDEWEAFLGLEEDLYGFDSVAALAAFVRTDDDNDLADHPQWDTVRKLKAEELIPDDKHSYDLIGVPELAAEDPRGEVIAELENALEITRIIGEVCELTPVTKFFTANPILGAVTVGTDNFHGREGVDLWVRIGRLIAKHWDDVIDALDDVVTTPEVDAEALVVAEDELDAAASAEDEDEPEFEPVDPLSDDEDTDDEQDDADDLDEEDEDEGFWAEVGIDPIRIFTDEGEFLTLRCYVGDKPVFLGSKGTIYGFSSERALTRYLAESNSHELARVSTYDEVQSMANAGELTYDVLPENEYALPGIDEDMLEGPRRVDSRQLDLAVELLTDAADFAGIDTVDEALRTTTPLGWFVDYAIKPDPNRLAPSGPFDNESESWRALVGDFEERLVRRG